MNSLSKIFEHIHVRRLTELLVDAVNHYSPSFAEGPVIDVFESAIRRMRVDYQFQEVSLNTEDPRRGNLIVQMGPDPPVFMWTGHMDTIDLWHEEGHRAEPEGDILYGLGTADMKSGCAAILEAIHAIVETGLPLKKGFLAALVVGEEEYGDGTRALLEEYSAPLTIIGEPTGLQPCISHYGYLESRLVSNGRRAHAALPEEGANAIQALLAWLMQIFEECKKLPFADRLAINPREIHGGEPSFVIAEKCEVLVDFHLPPDIPMDLIETKIEAAKLQVQMEYPAVIFERENVFRAEGFSNQENNPVFTPVKRAFQKTGLNWLPSVFRSHSDAALFYPTGTQIIVCGPGNLAVAHQREECVSLQEVERAARLYAAIIHEICMI